jgi:hypothetical protein
MHNKYKSKHPIPVITSTLPLYCGIPSNFSRSLGKIGVENITARKKPVISNGFNRSPTVALVLSLKTKPVNIFCIKRIACERLLALKITNPTVTTRRVYM